MKRDVYGWRLIPVPNENRFNLVVSTDKGDFISELDISDRYRERIKGVDVYTYHAIESKVLHQFNIYYYDVDLDRVPCVSSFYRVGVDYTDFLLERGLLV